MSSNALTRKKALWMALVAILGSALSRSTAHANIYATNIKLNGGTTNVVTSPGGKVNISYILNEPATAGVVISILSGSNVIRALSIASPNPGTELGLNSVLWDGKNTGGTPVGGGTYSVSIAAASLGYPGWTQTSDDFADGTYVWEGRGIDIDRNPLSRYYGRIFISNSHSNDYFGSVVSGDNVGMLKLNADSSPADEGDFSTGGYDWAGDYYSPWHLKVSDDGFVYVNDWTGYGLILRWDSILSDSSRLAVLREDNWRMVTNSDLTTRVANNLSGPAIVGSGTNLQVWMADITYPGTNGIIRYTVTTNGAIAPNDVGVSVVAAGSGSDLNLYPYDVALDEAGNIYTIQFRANAGDPSQRVFRFPAYDPSTNNGVAETKADWAIGAGDDSYGKAYAIAVDPTGTYVAVAFGGVTEHTGNTRILYATNGVEVTNLDLGIDISGESDHIDTACAWDAVGNVYYIDNWYGLWRSFSPPGPNQATTVAVDHILVAGASAAIQITQLTVDGSNATLKFSGAASDAASAFTVLSSSTITGSYAPASGANVTGSAGIFQAVVPIIPAASAQFYRIQR